jgi:electron transport complex protein RnfB
MRPSADSLDALLPQTQCRRCGFDGCRPYAEALAAGSAAVNRCPPGGRHVVRALAAMLGVPELPLDEDCGQEQPPAIAEIIEPDCIGCARCIEVCPTDAIVGARKWLHAVIEADCSGCELCLPSCPVDCIVMVGAPGLPPEPLPPAAIAARAVHFRRLYAARLARLERDRRRRQVAREARLEHDQTASR